MKKFIPDYDDVYGEIPDDETERLDYLKSSRKNLAKFEQDLKVAVRRIKRIGSKKIKFTLWKVVRPSARPRVNNRRGFPHMYVPRAAENGKWFDEWYKKSDLPFISTPCKINIDVYVPTPTSWPLTKKVLAEMKLLRPWNRTGDIDNYCKSILDMIQHGMLSDDCLVIESTQRLYYSIKPHVDIEITYMNKCPQ